MSHSLSITISWQVGIRFQVIIVHSLRRRLGDQPLSEALLRLWKREESLEDLPPIVKCLPEEWRKLLLLTSHWAELVSGPHPQVAWKHNPIMCSEDVDAEPFNKWVSWLLCSSFALKANEHRDNFPCFSGQSQNALGSKIFYRLI